jgi:proteasome lid subunit RPN8/RPN11
MNREEGNAAADEILLRRALVEEMYAHAREASPAECCGLLGGRGARAEHVYRLRNVAKEAAVAYEAAPEDLFAAQRLMRGRGEELLGIYHSHPRSADPVPSPTDVKLAFYPSALYFIVGLGGGAPVIRAFRIAERDGSWERAEFALTDG